MNNAQEIHRIALAGLLHDIGKFAQRAGEQVNRSWDEETKREFKYQHALHTWYLIQKYVPPDFQVGVLAAYHHAPQNATQRLIRLADQLSAGERDSGKNRDDSDRKTHPRQLHPVFTQVEMPEGKHPYHRKNKLYFPLKPLALQKNVIFPREAPLSDAEVWPAYDEMWKAFCEEAENLQALPLEVYLEAMQALMQRYTWSIPAAYFGAVPDVSLYDHSRMTAALAVCLHDFNDNEIESLHTSWQNGGDDTPVALLVGGDISGVQKFIYTISSKGAAKALRGRSFYLQLLTEAVLRFVLRELDLPYTNVIYSGGGHFFLLAPLSVEAKLPEVQAAISRKLIEHHGTTLYLALGWHEVPLKGFQLGKFPTHWDAMHKSLQEAKAHRYAELGETMHELVFQIPKDGGGDKHCAVCGADDVPLSKWKEESEIETQMICDQCRSYVEDLGATLPKTHYVQWHFTEPQDTPRGSFADTFKAFGVVAKLIKTKDRKTPSVETTPGDVLWALDDPQQDWPEGSDTAARWLRYAVNQIPWVEKTNQPLTFDKLQKKSASGFKRLGVIRMDVDNLGDVFKHGLREKSTLSRLSALSSQMSLFFDGWVKRIITKDDWADAIYAVYAGGDDLFLIGPWDQMPDLALRIVNDFSAYTGRHPGLHLSGGMAFINGKYPVYQAAKDAGAAESLAKDKEGKNAFAFLGAAWSWDEFKEIKAHQTLLRQLLERSKEAKGGSKSLLMLLRNLAQMESEAAQGKQRPVWGRWMWMAAYHLTRAMERNKEIKTQLEDIREDLEDSQYLTMPLWGTAARWAQLLTRKTQ